MNKVCVGDHVVGQEEPCFIIAEIGLNHNGDLKIAKRLIDAAALAGCHAVKFQKRTPDICVPPEQRNIPRETPWGLMTYMEYRYRVEFGQEEYAEINRYCQEKEMIWFASCWDEVSVEFMEQFTPSCLKIASASLTDDGLLRRYRQVHCPLILSTGMSTLAQIDHAVEILGTSNLILMHATSTYPAQLEELNLRAIQTLRERYQIPVGYSGHEVGLATTIAAVALGANAVERHITLDRAMWGGDQAASVEPQGMARLVRDIHAVETALGDGIKCVYESEIPVMKKLRRVG